MDWIWWHSHSGQVQFSLHLCRLDLADECQLFTYVTNVVEGQGPTTFQRGAPELRRHACNFLPFNFPSYQTLQYL
jgi:hypothetical protein